MNWQGRLTFPVGESIAILTLLPFPRKKGMGLIFRSTHVLCVGKEKIGHALNDTMMAHLRKKMFGRRSSCIKVQRNDFYVKMHKIFPLLSRTVYKLIIEH